MKSCFGVLVIFISFLAVIGGGALIWYLSSTAEFSRTTAGVNTTAAPRAQVVPQPAPKPTPSPFGER